jgi:hypothetical protein
MEKKSSEQETGNAGRINAFFRKAQQEIEELALQISLGKADALELFEHVKENFSDSMLELKRSRMNIKQGSPDTLAGLRTRIDELRVQLELGKTKAKEEFEEQKKKILSLVDEVEELIRSNPQAQIYYDEFKGHAEKLKLKLEILSMQAQLGSLEIKDTFRKEMDKARSQMDSVFAKVEDKANQAKTGFSTFNSEMEKAFSHIKAAVKSL